MSKKNTNISLSRVGIWNVKIQVINVNETDVKNGLVKLKVKSVCSESVLSEIQEGRGDKV